MHRFLCRIFGHAWSPWWREGLNYTTCRRGCGAKEARP